MTDSFTPIEKVAADLPAGREGRVAPWQGLAAFADQALVSLANFACTILVARAAGEVELGLYALGFLIFVLLTGLAKSLIWTPYTSLFPRLTSEQQREFSASVTWHLGVLLVISAATLATAGLACMALLPHRATFGRLLLTLAPATGLLLLREHVRCLSLARMELRGLLAFDGAVSATQAAGLAILFAAGHLNATTAYWAMALACCWCLPWLYVRRDQFALRTDAVRADWRRVWEISRWITPNAVMFQIGNQSPRWLLEALYGLREMGLFMAGQVVIQMANPLVLGNANYFGPRSATIYARQGAAGLWDYTIRNTLFLLTLVVGLAIAAGIVGPTFISYVYGDGFRVDRALLVPLAFGMLSDALLTPIDFALLTLGKASLSTAVGTLRLAINLTITSALVYGWGAPGIGYGLLLANLAALVWMWLAFWRETARSTRRDYELALDGGRL